jgi:hypothetical protein
MTNVCYTRDELRAVGKETYYNRSTFFNSLEFERDINNVLTAKKMISRFLKSGQLNEKLLLNNVVVALNAFGIKTTNIMFRMICSETQFSVIKAFLMFLRCWDNISGEAIQADRIIIDILLDTEQRYNLNHL